MSTIAAITLKCVHCGGQEPPGISFPDAETFKQKVLPEKFAKCGHCGQMTPIRKDLMTVTFVDGSVKNGAEV